MTEWCAFRALLPTACAEIGRESMFKKQELASRSQDAGDSSNGVGQAGDDAQREGVLTTVSTLASGNGIRSPGKSRNSK
jgi:hypothetical protein